MAGYYILDVAKLSKQRKGNDKQPFPHQRDAFAKLSDTLPTPIKGYKGTLLVLPTGGGKTYTAVNWVCRNILTKHIKILWLAQSSYLIDQAANTFISEIHNAVGRDMINLRVVSSSTSHSNTGSISLTDDILICTTQTAISSYSSTQLDGAGNVAVTPFRRFVENCKDTQLFVIVDEAHHTPAYGCRNLLLSMRDVIFNLYVLGLTATPMHMDKRISGWLKNIYDRWICYEADKNLLQANKVLSVPKYIEKDTGMEFEVDDTLFDRLVKKHKDLPENIIENLARNQSRNDFIISDYFNNRSSYGKTLIFADRWFQCEYLTEKLKAQGIKAGAVYSIISEQDSVYYSGSGRRNNAENETVMRDFRDGKLDVVVNVKMLTEGVDVPDVKTVMITRQTTSSILLTQMIGRALRGEKAGGGKEKSYANIVFFTDSWRRVLPWADATGGLDNEPPIAQRRNPLELVSIQLIRLATADIEYKGFEDASFLTFIPTGFYGCDYTVAVSEDTDEELITFAENVIVYEFSKNKYDALLDHLIQCDLTDYAAEKLTDDDLIEKAEELLVLFFDADEDGFDGLLTENIIKLIRHIAQNGNKPEFIDFKDRDLYDLDRLADELLNTPPLEADTMLNKIYHDSKLHWAFFYKGFDNFMDAYYKAQKRILAIRRGKPAPVVISSLDNDDDILTDAMKEQVFTRDNFTCQCCGKRQRKGVSLNADHIKPISMGGRNAVSNLQTLCKYCNSKKGVNEIDYRVNITPMRQPKDNLKLHPSTGSDYCENAISRIVNDFYHCKAMCKLNYHQRKNGQYYYKWEVVLYKGNDPLWLTKYANELLNYINSTPGWEHVQSVIIKN